MNLAPSPSRGTVLCKRTLVRTGGLLTQRTNVRLCQNQGVKAETKQRSAIEFANGH